jgi:methylglutaconyl-CoA hydratase
MRTLAALISLGRFLIGATFVARPKLLEEAWIGRQARLPGAQVLGRAVGARDLTLGLGGLQALAIDATAFRDAQWAERRGLYAQLFDTTEELDRAVDALAATLARSNPDAMARMKRVFWEGTEHWAKLLEERAATSGALVLSEFTRAALAEFGKKG